MRTRDDPDCQWFAIVLVLLRSHLYGSRFPFPRWEGFGRRLGIQMGQALQKRSARNLGQNQLGGDESQIVWIWFPLAFRNSGSEFGGYVEILPFLSQVHARKAHHRSYHGVVNILNTWFSKKDSHLKNTFPYPG